MAFTAIKDQRRRKTDCEFKCETCDKTFSEAGSLRKHALIHAGVRPYLCEMCDKTFTQVGTLYKHRFTHTGRRSHVCKTCDKAFAEWGNLRKHELIHTGEKPFICEICNKGFNQSGILINHKRIHTGERRFACDLCEKSYTEAGTLRKHKLVHTGERPYVCKICDRRFMQSRSLRKHEEAIHASLSSFACENYNEEISKISKLSRISADELMTSAHRFDASSFNQDRQTTRSHSGSALEDHGVTLQLFGCGICGKMFREIDDTKTCFYRHVEYVTSTTSHCDTTCG